jgi:fermentation-respiration switch protein FrsA (DUF1100 family)
VIRVERSRRQLTDRSTWGRMITVATALFSSSVPPDDLKRLVARISPRPVFLIYTDHGVDSEDLNPGYYAAAGQPKTIWSIPEASHTGASLRGRRSTSDA